MAAAAAALAAAAAAHAAPPATVLTLVDPATNLTEEPPLAAGPVRGEIEPQIFRQRVDSRQRVAVGVDPAGRPVTIAVTQRLRLVGKGDYLYSVPAPVLSVVRTADSESAPGQRQGAILWAGFSPGLRLLGSRAQLQPRRIAGLLPLEVSLRATVDGEPLRPGEPRTGRLQIEFTLRNTTRTAAPSATARADPRTLVRALDAARRGDYPRGGVSIAVENPVDSRISQVEAPLEVTGELTFPAGTIADRASRFPFSVLLGDGLPLGRAVIGFSGRGVGITAPKIRLTARTVEPKRTLVPPHGASWTEALRLDPGLDTPALLTAAEDAYLSTARAHQYDLFLANPGVVQGTNEAVYVYTSATATAAPAPVPGGGGGLGALGLALVVAGGLALAGGLAVAWAYA